MWEFEIATGRRLVDPKARVKTYPVDVEADQIVVYADPAIGLPLRTCSAASCFSRFIMSDVHGMVSPLAICASPVAIAC
jgi:hypothetical protein